MAVWHTNLPSYLADSIECVQKRALKCIHPGKNYDEVLHSLKIPTLKESKIPYVSSILLKCVLKAIN